MEESFADIAKSIDLAGAGRTSNSECILGTMSISVDRLDQFARTHSCLFDCSDASDTRFVVPDPVHWYSGYTPACCDAAANLLYRPNSSNDATSFIRQFFDFDIFPSLSWATQSADAV